MKEKIKYYRSLRDSGGLRVNFSFIVDMEEMDMAGLRTTFYGNILEYEVHEILLSALISSLGHNLMSDFPIGHVEIDEHTVRLIEFINTSEQIIPPEICYVNQGLWAIRDGKHRIGLARFQNSEKIPVLIKSHDVKYIKQLK